MRNKSRPALIAASLAAVLLASACGQSNTSNASNASAPPSTSPSAPASSASGSEAFQSAVDAYRQYVIDQTDQFVKSTDAFVQAIRGGDVDKAKSLYAPSRMFYERIEPIAESLGDFDPWIDAREGDVPDAEWRGYHKLEKALWVDGKLDGQTAAADQLLQDVKQLRVKMESVEIDTPMLVTGAVELLNEVSSSKVTGEEERYSHTDLYDFAANVEGAKEIYLVLQSDVKKKKPELAAEIEERFAELDKTLEPYRKDGGYVLYTALKEDEVKKLSQAIDALAEPLSQVGSVVEA
ncbi:iron uptake system protein EfeO [Cohnella sp. REN36]|uniref:iron uptake system protein EfeO n=1 Tax=Cohnella sp. REN36 TaxID=2887347 RepID=UPI001D151231|nr:iron uptake system protein EfeO [Cohnella sp. REN36]MCC3371654.1 EfeM/EfeO family lipoprotein [Cohnella sp. REN36]